MDQGISREGALNGLETPSRLYHRQRRRRLLLRNEYLVAENRILKNQIEGRLKLTDAERKTLAEIGKKLGKKSLEEVANVVKPETILGWHRRLIAKKFDGSKKRRSPGRPPG